MTASLKICQESGEAKSLLEVAHVCHTVSRRSLKLEARSVSSVALIYFAGQLRHCSLTKSHSSAASCTFSSESLKIFA